MAGITVTKRGIAGQRAYLDSPAIPVIVNSTPAGAATPAGGWSCVLADGFNVARPFSGLFAPNRNANNGDYGLVRHVGGFNRNEVQWFAPGQVIPMADGMHLRAQYAGGVVIPPLGSTSQTGNATLSAGLSTGGAITSLPVTSLGGGSGLFAGLLTNDQVVVMDSTAAHTQVWTLSAGASGGAATLAVNSQTPNFAYPSGSVVSACTYVSGCLSSQPTLPAGGETGFPIQGFTFLPTAGVSFAFETVINLPAGTMPGGDMGWWAIAGTGTNEIDFAEWLNYDQNVSGVWDLVATWIDHVHSTSNGQEIFSNTTSFPAQTDARFHRWTTELRASDSTVHTFLDGVELTGLAYSWLGGFNTGSTDYMHLLLSHALRNVYSGKGPSFTGFYDVVVRSVAAYVDSPHVGGSAYTGGGVARGTVVI